MQNLVFSSVNYKSSHEGNDPFSDRPLPPGTYKSTCEIPQNFLNDDCYSIRVILAQDIANIVADVENAVSFSVNDTGSMRKEYQGGWGGIIRPKLKWMTTPC